ncbi:AHH domain-containing protein [Novosphingobium sp. KCTC 2891]|uniref:AHH domain-containing protein n=1 Tax=Novosphingobium sp. KCTC 2891 TaxID=2989730 RepID=UPI0022223FA7|nr:AHH domain-containing protein [Novosphingobium sp. KCTC 2891]MCW1381762.1 AHH domain-containing protein [Novosphingobium sp. KCTC 2891]
MTAGARTALPFRAVNVFGARGYVAGLQRHHVLPRQLLGHGGLKRMFAALDGETLGFHDFRRNGLLLPACERQAERAGLPLHRGPHRRYSELVLERAGQIEAGWQRAGQVDLDRACREALMRFDLLQKALRRRLLDPRRWQGPSLHRRDPNRRDPALDFSHLDQMAEMLWADTATEA